MACWVTWLIIHWHCYQDHLGIVIMKIIRIKENWKGFHFLNFSRRKADCSSDLYIHFAFPRILWALMLVNFVNEHQPIHLQHPMWHFFYTLLVSMTLQIIFFFPYHSYTSINITLYKRKDEIACNGKSPGQQGTLHSITVLIFHFRNSKKYYFCRNSHQAGSKKENSIFKSQLKGVNHTTVKTFQFCAHVCLYLLTI